MLLLSDDLKVVSKLPGSLLVYLSCVMKLIRKKKHSYRELQSKFIKAHGSSDFCLFFK